MALTLRKATEADWFDAPVQAEAPGAPEDGGGPYAVLPADGEGNTTGVRMRLARLGLVAIRSVWADARAEVGKPVTILEERLEEPNAQNRGKDREVIARRHIPDVAVEEDELNTSAGVLMLQRAILDWEGVLTASGEPLPCDDDWKLAMAEEYPGLVRWVTSTVVDAANFREIAKVREVAQEATFCEGSNRARAQVPDVAVGVPSVRNGAPQPRGSAV